MINLTTLTINYATVVIAYKEHATELYNMVVSGVEQISPNPRRFPKPRQADIDAWENRVHDQLVDVFGERPNQLTNTIVGQLVRLAMMFWYAQESSELVHRDINSVAYELSNGVQMTPKQVVENYGFDYIREAFDPYLHRMKDGTSLMKSFRITDVDENGNLYNLDETDKFIEEPEESHVYLQLDNRML